MGDSGANLLGFLLACVAVQGAEDRGRRCPGLPARDPRRAHPRHRLRGGQAHQVLAAKVHARTAGTSITASRTSASPSGGRSPTCTGGRWPRRPWRWPCASCPTPTTTGTSNAGWTLVMLASDARSAATGLPRVRAEILKFRRFRERQLRRSAQGGGPAPSRRRSRRSRARSRDRRVRGGGMGVRAPTRVARTWKRPGTRVRSPPRSMSGPLPASDRRRAGSPRRYNILKERPIGPHDGRVRS